MKLSATFRAPRLDLAAYEKTLREHMAEAVAHAASEWLNGVKEMIPVWSGASRATLLILARRVEFDIAISPVVPSRMDLGLTNATGDLHLSSLGEMSFSYATTLEHLVYNEYNNANLIRLNGKQIFHLTNPGPYNFQGAGLAAFKRYAATVTLPSPYQALKPVTIK